MIGIAMFGMVGCISLPSLPTQEDNSDAVTVDVQLHVECPSGSRPVISQANAITEKFVPTFDCRPPTARFAWNENTDFHEDYFTSIQLRDTAHRCTDDMGESVGEIAWIRPFNNGTLIYRMPIEPPAPNSPGPSLPTLPTTQPQAPISLLTTRVTQDGLPNQPSCPAHATNSHCTPGENTAEVKNKHTS